MSEGKGGELSNSEVKIMLVVREWFERIAVSIFQLMWMGGMSASTYIV